MMKRAWRAWFFRERMWSLYLAVGVMVVWIWRDFRDGRLDTMSIVGLTVLGVGGALFVSAYLVGLRRCQEKLELVSGGKACYTLGEDRIEAVSGLGSLSLQWSAVAELRRYEDLVLLGFKGTAYSTIPASQIPAEALAFLVERCRAAGARMVGL